MGPMTMGSLVYAAGAAAIVFLAALLVITVRALLELVERARGATVDPEESFWRETYGGLLASATRNAGEAFLLMAPKNARVARVMADAALVEYRRKWRPCASCGELPCKRCGKPAPDPVLLAGDVNGGNRVGLPPVTAAGDAAWSLEKRP